MIIMALQFSEKQPGAWFPGFESSARHRLSLTAMRKMDVLVVDFFVMVLLHHQRIKVGTCCGAGISSARRAIIINLETR